MENKDKNVIGMVKCWELSEIGKLDKICYTNTLTNSTGMMYKSEFETFYRPMDTTWHGEEVFIRNRSDSIDTMLEDVQQYVTDIGLDKGCNIKRCYEAYLMQYKHSSKDNPTINGRNNLGQEWALNRLYETIDCKIMYK